MKRTRREIEGDLFGAPSITKVDKFDPTDVTVVPERKPVHTTEAQAVRDAISTADAKVAIRATNAEPKRYKTAPCPTCGYVADEISRDFARTAYVMHRARERQPALLDGEFGGTLKPYHDEAGS